MPGAFLDEAIRGFRRLEQDGQGENWEYFVLPEAWRGEMCTGLDAATIAKAMIAKGWMKAGEGKHHTRLVRVPGVGKTPALLHHQQLPRGRTAVNGAKLGSALAKMRVLASLVPPVPTSDLRGWGHPGGDKPQQMQGFDDAGTHWYHWYQ